MSKVIPFQDLRLEFVEWDLRPADEVGCADVLTLYDGPTVSDPLIAEYCGSDYPDVTSMTSDQILVEFQSLDFYYPYDGKFRVKFSSINVTGKWLTLDCGCSIVDLFC
jgi:hypothetical protein